MSIYKEVLGEQYCLLHPMLQKRYELPIGKPFQGSGIMKKISRGPVWLMPFLKFGAKRKFLFPEYGTNIPFTITNTSRRGSNDELQVYWERTFHFPGKSRKFNALMSRDAGSNVVKDYLGEPALFYSELIFFIAPGGNMRIESRKQRFVLGIFEIPLPKFLQGMTAVTEGYSKEKDLFTIDVQILNPLFGPLFSYEGEFKANEL